MGNVLGFRYIFDILAHKIEHLPKEPPVKSFESNGVQVRIFWQHTVSRNKSCQIND